MLNKQYIAGWDNIKAGDICYRSIDNPYYYMSQDGDSVYLRTNLNENVKVDISEIRLIKHDNYNNFRWLQHYDDHSIGEWFDVVQENGDNKKVDNGYGVRIPIADSLKTIWVNESKIDLFKPRVQLPDAELPIKIDDYDSVSKVYIDIETTGLNPQHDRITMIGIRNEVGRNIVITNSNEKIILEEFNKILTKKQPKLIFLHNGYNFDIPFIETRCNLLKLPFIFEVTTIFKRQIKKSAHGAIKRIFKNEKNSEYGGEVNIYSAFSGKSTILDTMLLLGLWDSTKKLPNLKLKPSVINLGLRTDDRTELTNDEIQHCWRTGDIDTLTKYLIGDLEDTEMLADHLMPSIWYQQSYIPNDSLLNLCYKNTGYKIQKMFEYLYPNANETISKEKHNHKDEKHDYGGGLTGAITGIYENVAKIDVNSLYPSIMCRYNITTRKDTDNKFISILQSMLTDRLMYKQKGKDGDNEAAAMAEAIKLIMNSSYGFLGNSGYTFNDMLAGAMVTAHGRCILRLMATTIENLGGKLISVDTDGIYFSSNDYQLITDEVSKILPEGITIDLEKKNLVMFSRSKKNYCLYKNDGTLVTMRGNSFLSNNNKLKSDFINNYPKLIITKGQDTADKYYNDIINRLSKNDIPIDDLSITTKVLDSWVKKKVNLSINSIGDVVSFYYTRHDYHPLKNNYSKNRKYIPLETLSNSGLPYFSKYYCWEIKSIRAELLGLPEPNKDYQDMPKTVAKKNNMELLLNI